MVRSTLACLTLAALAAFPPLSAGEPSDPTLAAEGSVSFLSDPRDDSSLSDESLRHHASANLRVRMAREMMDAGDRLGAERHISHARVHLRQARDVQRAMGRLHAGVAQSLSDAEGLAAEAGAGEAELEVAEGSEAGDGREIRPDSFGACWVVGWGLKERKGERD